MEKVISPQSAAICYNTHVPQRRNGRHNRPHVHVLYGDDECVLSVPEGEVLAGDIPGRQLRNAQTFIDMRTEELMLNWKLCMEGKDVVWIDSIR